MSAFPKVDVRESGTFAYAAGTSTGTVDVPATARLRYIHVVAGASAATLTINGGATITVPANTVFTTNVNSTTVNQDVVIGGVPASYYVDWFV